MLRRVLRALIGVAAALSASGRAASAADTGAVADSAHYHLVSSGPQNEADEWTRVLEAAWPQYLEFFGKAPPLAKGERLHVSFFETNADMQAAIKEGGGVPPSDAGGYYDPVSKTAYAWRQPSRWFTRALILHECAHQFHWRGKGFAKAPPHWYVEGVAEHLSHHTWDGEHLRLCAVPMLSLEDWPTIALDELKKGAVKLDDALDGKVTLDRPACMHLVRYLCQGEGGKLKPKFDDLAATLDRGGKFSSSQFARTFGPTPKFLAAMQTWVASVQQPWECVFVEWDARGENALRGSSPSVPALCRRRAETKSVAARVRPVGDGPWKAGVLLRFGGPKDYDVGLVTSGGRAMITRMANGIIQVLADVAAPAVADNSWRVEGVRDGGKVKFIVNGEAAGEAEAPPGAMGLAIDACTADFTDIACK